jgi:hypothetical protein
MKEGSACLGVVAIYLAMFLAFGVVCSAPLEYTCEFWASYAAEKPVDLDFEIVFVAAMIPPIGVFGGLLGGFGTWVFSEAVDNPHYVPN